MGDESIINSPGQLRLFEQDHGWLPGDTAGDAGGTGTSTGSAIGSMAGGEAGSGANTASNGMDESKPFTWQQGAQNAAFSNGGYFSHDNKLYQQRDGKTYLITGDPSGDVELDAEQSGQLDMARAATAEHEKKTKDAMAQQPIVSEGFTNTPRSMFGGTIVAGNGDLCLYDANDNLTGLYPYTSGVSGVTDPSIRDKGPIPPGGYTLNSGDISEANGLRYLLRNNPWSDWGHYRVPLVPDPNTDTHGRGGFFLHGGSRPGSLGCIDVGKGEAQLFPELQQNGENYRLIVK